MICAVLALVLGSFSNYRVVADDCYTEQDDGPCCTPSDSDLMLCNNGDGPPCFAHSVACGHKYYLIVSYIGSRASYTPTTCPEQFIDRECAVGENPPEEVCCVVRTIAKVHGSLRESGNPCANHLEE